MLEWDTEESDTMETDKIWRMLFSSSTESSNYTLFLVTWTDGFSSTSSVAFVILLVAVSMLIRWPEQGTNGNLKAKLKQTNYSKHFH